MISIRMLSLGAVVLFSFPAITLAADVPQLPLASLRPVAVTAEEGQISALVTPVPVIATDAVTTQATVRIDNTSTLPEFIHLETVDYIVDGSGKPAPAPAGYALGSAAWYQLDETDFLLPSGMSVDIGLTAAAPATAAAGDHSAALQVSVRADRSGLPAPVAGATVESMLMFQVRLQHRIPGAMPQSPTISLDAIPDGGAVTFHAYVNNVGNTVLSYQHDPGAEIVLFNTSAWADQSRPERSLQIDAFYVGPASERVVVVNWPDAPLFGSYRAVVTLPGVDGLPPTSAETLFTTVNVPAVAALIMSGVVLMVLSTAGLWWWRRRASRRVPVTTTWAWPTPMPADHAA